MSKEERIAAIVSVALAGNGIAPESAKMLAQELKDTLREQTIKDAIAHEGWRQSIESTRDDWPPALRLEPEAFVDGSIARQVREWNARLDTLSGNCRSENIDPHGFCDGIADDNGPCMCADCRHPSAKGVRR